MRICIVAPYDPRPAALASDPDALHGGVEQALDRAAHHLARRGHDVTLVTSAREASVRVDADGVRAVRVKRRGVVFRAPVAPLRRAIPRDADVIHVPATYPFLSDWIPFRERRPVVLDHHFEPHGTSAPMRAAAALHARTLGRGMLRWSARVLAKSEDHVGTSRALARVPSDKIDIVPNGVDVDAFPLKRDRGEGILCVGRLVPYKGVDVLLRAMPRIHAETGATLRVVGDGPERARLERMAPPSVEFAGRVPAEALAAAYADARVTVLPSANGQEAFGITLLESMATGTPVVASDLPGVREVARVAGLVAPPLDADALARRVIEAYRTPSAFGTPSAIRARVARAYGWPSVIDRLEASYAKAVAGA